MKSRNPTKLGKLLLKTKLGTKIFNKLVNKLEKAIAEKEIKDICSKI